MEKIKFIMSGLWTFLRPFIFQLMTQGGQLLAQVAMEAVTEVEQSMRSADGAQKRAQAFDSIQSELKRSGVKIAASVVNAAIEAAVVAIKSN